MVEDLCTYHHTDLGIANLAIDPDGSLDAHFCCPWIHLCPQLPREGYVPKPGRATTCQRQDHGRSTRLRTGITYVPTRIEAFGRLENLVVSPTLDTSDQS